MLFIEYIKKYWSEILVSICIVLIIWLMIFYLYPIYLRHVFNYHNPVTDLSIEAQGFGRGTFGDMYGALNSFLSGLGFLGLLITIVVQIKQFKGEKDFQRAETSKSIINDANNVLEFIKNAGGILIEENTELIRRIDQVLVSRSIESLNPTTDILYEKLCTYDLEKSYTSFTVIHPDRENDTIFRVFQLFKNSYNFKIELSTMTANAKLDDLNIRKRHAIMDLLKNINEASADFIPNSRHDNFFLTLSDEIIEQLENKSEIELNELINKIKDIGYLRSSLVTFSCQDLSIISKDLSKAKEEYFKRLGELKANLMNTNDSLTTQLQF